MNKENITCVIAAGGTGGHVFPAEAVADEMQKAGHRVVLITDRRFKSYGGMLGQVEKHTIRSGTTGRGWFSKLTAVTDILVGLFQAHRLLAKIKPDIVIGFGGYPSFPTVRAAVIRGIPVLIHEQNSVLGRANRMLAHGAKAIATSFTATQNIPSVCAEKVVWVGNPVRASVRALSEVPYTEIKEDGIIRLLVTGGSQGASIFAKAIPSAVAHLPLALRKRLRIDQQCREVEIELVKAEYNALHMQVDVASFFTDIPARLAAAHLVIARAGASTVSELAVAGRPAILVPLPSAMDDHQTSNAKALEDAGAAWLMDQAKLTPQLLAAKLEALFLEPATLLHAADQAKKVAKLHATEDLVRLILHVASRAPVSDYILTNRR